MDEGLYVHGIDDNKCSMIDVMCTLYLLEHEVFIGTPISGNSTR